MAIKNLVAVTDRYNRVVGWFDIDAASVIPSDTIHQADGDDVCMATRSTKSTQTLYQTDGEARWILGAVDHRGYATFHLIEDDSWAQRWIVAFAPAELAEHFPMTPAEVWFDLDDIEDDELFNV